MTDLTASPFQPPARNQTDAPAAEPPVHVHPPLRVLDTGTHDDSREITLTVERLKKIGATEKAQGRRQGARDLADELGFDTVEDLTAFVSEHRECTP